MSKPEPNNPATPIPVLPVPSHMVTEESLPKRYVHQLDMQFHLIVLLKDMTVPEIIVTGCLLATQ